MTVFQILNGHWLVAHSARLSPWQRQKNCLITKKNIKVLNLCRQCFGYRNISKKFLSAQLSIGILFESERTRTPLSTHLDQVYRWYFPLYLLRQWPLVRRLKKTWYGQELIILLLNKWIVDMMSVLLVQGKLSCWGKGTEMHVWSLLKNIWTSLLNSGMIFYCLMKLEVWLFRQTSARHAWRKDGNAYDPKNIIPIYTTGNFIISGRDVFPVMIEQHPCDRKNH